MQKSVKKVTQEKECNTMTDHQFKVENNLQCNQVQEKVCNSVSEYVCSTESVQEYQTTTVKENTTESL